MTISSSQIQLAYERLTTQNITGLLRLHDDNPPDRYSCPSNRPEGPRHHHSSSRWNLHHLQAPELEMIIRKDPNPKITKNSPWHKAKKRKIKRVDPLGYIGDIDPGVNYFIEKLESLGCITCYSCEGHSIEEYKEKGKTPGVPFDFYIVFRKCPSSLAKKIIRTLPHCGQDLTLNLWQNKWRWILRLNFFTNECKESALSELSEVWEKEL